MHSRTEISILNLGQSNCILFENKNQLSLINVGSDENCSKNDILNFIHYKGYWSIDDIYIQNEYSKNKNSLQYLQEKIKIKSLYDFNDRWDQKFEIIEHLDKTKSKSFKYIVIKESKRIVVICPDLTIDNLNILSRNLIKGEKLIY